MQNRRRKVKRAKRNKMQKKGAIELSISTIVVIVLAMTMLIMGLVLVRTIFSGAKYNVEQMNDKVQEQIKILFVGDEEMVVYLSNQKADIKQGNSWGVAWGVKNLKTGTADVSKLSYVVSVSDDDIRTKCGITKTVAEGWISTGKSESNIPLMPGKIYPGLVRISAPKNAPLCIIRYRIDTKLDGVDYYSKSFDVEVTA
jgi:hypothetical protein